MASVGLASFLNIAKLLLDWRLRLWQVLHSDIPRVRARHPPPPGVPCFSLSLVLPAFCFSPAGSPPIHCHCPSPTGREAVTCRVQFKLPLRGTSYLQVHLVCFLSLPVSTELHLRRDRVTHGQSRHPIGARRSLPLASQERFVNTLAASPRPTFSSDFESSQLSSPCLYLIYMHIHKYHYTHAQVACLLIPIHTLSSRLIDDHNIHTKGQPT